MAEEKSLHRMPSADCGDYEEIPLPESPWQTVGVRGGRAKRGRCPRIPFCGSLLGLRRNNRSRQRRDKKSPPLSESPWQTVGIRGGRAQRGRCPRIPSKRMRQRHRTSGAITSAEPTLPLATRATNMSESE